ncbi:hypothetical protein [Streptomyces sp. NBC_00063]
MSSGRVASALLTEPLLEQTLTPGTAASLPPPTPRHGLISSATT